MNELLQIIATGLCLFAPHTATTMNAGVYYCVTPLDKVACYYVVEKQAHIVRQELCEELVGDHGGECREPVGGVCPAHDMPFIKEGEPGPHKQSIQERKGWQ